MSLFENKNTQLLFRPGFWFALALVFGVTAFVLGLGVVPYWEPAAYLAGIFLAIAVLLFWLSNWGVNILSWLLTGIAKLVLGPFK